MYSLRKYFQFLFATLQLSSQKFILWWKKVLEGHLPTLVHPRYYPIVYHIRIHIYFWTKLYTWERYWNPGFLQYWEFISLSKQCSLTFPQFTCYIYRHWNTFPSLLILGMLFVRIFKIIISLLIILCKLLIFAIVNLCILYS